jgi:hypothetical protein
VLADQVVAEGDLVNGYRVLEIHPEFVRLRKAGRTHQLFVGETP